jgi:hypothetical protein
MKTVMILGTILMSMNAFAQADRLPDGAYKGQGLWKSANQSGHYEVSTEIRGEKVISSYKRPNGTAYQWEMTMKPAKNGFFTVISRGAEVGKGYCLEHTTLCHYDLAAKGLELEETLTIQDGKLYKYGSKTENGTLVMWQEALYK